MTSYLELIDHNTGGRRCHVTPVFANYAAFAGLVGHLAQLFDSTSFDLVAGIAAIHIDLNAATRPC